MHLSPANLTFSSLKRDWRFSLMVVFGITALSVVIFLRPIADIGVRNSSATRCEIRQRQNYCVPLALQSCASGSVKSGTGLSNASLKS